MKEYLLYESKFKVRGHDVDIHQKCSPTGFMRMMHEAAQEHILKYKVSAKELIKQNLGWIVLNQFIEIIGEARFGDELKIVTYPSGLDKIFTYRDYVVLNQEDELIARSCGRFIMLNLGTREMAKIPQYIMEMIGDTSSLYNIEPPEKIRLKKKELIRTQKFRVRYSDLDFNHHVGNQVYYEWMLDSFEYAFLKKHSLNYIHLSFKEEVRFGNEITSNIYLTEDQSFEHELLSNSKSICTGISKWM